ncbi:hypothetical protein [Thermosulfurimonas dismutans]|uniref:Uncharacterized protein n=1 Tax=Thermosulfurimonas dismutans TaxID=999894 RepID=A0A179D6Q6_9BACT|nr:hypothetical protein [Thermosulfurimonas dismutans]OAQ21653.1 hypothetical protein TDIS_0171 [Thermosulfurimonas dismutans]
MRVPKWILGFWLVGCLLLWTGDLKADEGRKLLLVITTNETETVWQALRLSNFAISQGDEVRIYLTGKGVELLKMDNSPLDVAQKLESFLKNGGEVYG